MDSSGAWAEGHDTWTDTGMDSTVLVSVRELFGDEDAGGHGGDATRALRGAHARNAAMRATPTTRPTAGLSGVCVPPEYTQRYTVAPVATESLPVSACCIAS